MHHRILQYQSLVKAMRSLVEISLEKKLFDLIEAYKQDTRLNNDQQEDRQDLDKKNSLTITYIQVEKVTPRIKTILEDNFQYIIELVVVNCNLRTFENFPKLKSLKNLNASKNSLRGSFEFLVKNRAIKYIDVSSNIIADIKRFQPLKYLKQVSLYAKDNPFDTRKNNEGASSKPNFIEELKSYGIKYLENSLNTKKDVKKQEALLKITPAKSADEDKNSKTLIKIEKDRKLVLEREEFGLEDIAYYMRSRLSRRASQIEPANARSSPMRQQDAMSNSQNHSILRVESNASGSVRDQLEMEQLQHFIQENEEEDDEDDDDGEDLDDQEIQFFVNLERQQREARRRSRFVPRGQRLPDRLQSQSNLMDEFSSVLSEDSELDDDDNDV